MSKRLVARVGTYQKDGQDKSEYCNLGIILSNENGEYGLLDPTVNLAGVLLKQNILAQKEGKPLREKIAFSIYENDSNNGQTAPQPQYNQQPTNQAATQQYAQPRPPAFTPPPMGNVGTNNNSDEMPF